MFSDPTGDIITNKFDDWDHGATTVFYSTSPNHLTTGTKRCVEFITVRIRKESHLMKSMFSVIKRKI